MGRANAVSTYLPSGITPDKATKIQVVKAEEAKNEDDIPKLEDDPNINNIRDEDRNVTYIKFAYDPKKVKVENENEIIDIDRSLNENGYERKEFELKNCNTELFNDIIKNKDLGGELINFRNNFLRKKIKDYDIKPLKIYNEIDSISPIFMCMEKAKKDWQDMANNLQKDVTIVEFDQRLRGTDGGQNFKEKFDELLLEIGCNDGIVILVSCGSKTLACTLQKIAFKRNWDKIFIGFDGEVHNFGEFITYKPATTSQIKDYIKELEVIKKKFELSKKYRGQSFVLEKQYLIDKKI